MYRVTTMWSSTILLTSGGPPAQPAAPVKTPASATSAPATEDDARAMRDPRPRRGRSQGHVAMFLRRVAVALVGQDRQPRQQARARVARPDDLVDVAELG